MQLLIDDGVYPSVIRIGVAANYRRENRLKLTTLFNALIKGDFVNCHFETGIYRRGALGVPPTGLEPVLPAPEAGALSN